MEYREYKRILLRRWWLIVLLPLLAGIFSFLTAPGEQEQPPITYVYELEYSVSFIPLDLSQFPQEQDSRLSAVQASEYVADDLTEIFVGSKFAEFVQQYMRTDKSTAAIGQAVRTAKAHRLVIIVMRAFTAEEVEELAEAVKLAVENDLTPFLNDLWEIGEMRLELTDDSGVFSESPPLTPEESNIPVRILLAFIAAIAIAFGLDYLDDSIRVREEAEQLVGRVLAEIPSRTEG